MSNYLNQKKESILRINRLIDDLQSTKDVKEALEQTKFKYDRLVKQYEQLNQVFEFHKGIIQNISSCIITIDRDGKITFMNKSALQLTGYRSDEILGEQLGAIFADKEEGLLILKQVLSLKKMFESKEVNLESVDGTIIPIGFSTTILKEEKTDD